MDEEYEEDDDDFLDFLESEEEEEEEEEEDDDLFFLSFAFFASLTAAEISLLFPIFLLSEKVFRTRKLYHNSTNTKFKL